MNEHGVMGIGSDLDGFIKPTVGGLDYVDQLESLRPGLEKRFPGQAGAILSGNAVRVLRKVLAARA
jgi:microsomal dipeptidase-like Zn-dependent dipeptidase